MTVDSRFLRILSEKGAGWLCIALLGGTAAFGAVAAEPSGDGAQYDCEGYSPVDVFDSEASSEVRKAAIGVVQRSALVPECAYERYVLGLLYRHGADLAGNPLPRDPVRARQLLESYALEGDVQAFAELAEFALAESDGRAAMQWTQVYLHLLREQNALVDDFDLRGYNADLLQRATLAMKRDRSRPDRTSAKALLNDYLGMRNEALVARSAERRARLVREQASASSGGDGTLKVKRRPADPATSSQRMQPGYAVFLLEVQPEGTVTRIVAEAFAPTRDNALKLRPLVEGFEFHPFHGDAPQIVRIPVVYGTAFRGAPTLKAK